MIGYIPEGGYEPAAHEQEAELGPDAAFRYATTTIGETTTIGVLHELAAQVHWLAAETRAARLAAGRKRSNG